MQFIVYVTKCIYASSDLRCCRSTRLHFRTEFCIPFDRPKKTIHHGLIQKWRRAELLLPWWGGGAHCRNVSFLATKFVYKLKMVSNQNKINSFWKGKCVIIARIRIVNVMSEKFFSFSWSNWVSLLEEGLVEENRPDKLMDNVGGRHLGCVDELVTFIPKC